MKARLLQSGHILLESGEKLAPGEAGHLRIANFLRGRIDFAEDNWSAYQGKFGGKGWRNASTGAVVYQADKPGTRGEAQPSTNGNGKPHATNGQAAPSSNGNGKADTPEAPHEKQANEGAAKKLADPGIASKITSLPGKVASMTKAFVSNLYSKAEEKYGPRWAKAIVATAIITLPTPVTLGAVAAMTGLAAAYTHFKPRPTATTHAEFPDMTEEQVKAAADQFLKDMHAGMKQMATELRKKGEKLPEMPQNGQVAEHADTIDAVSVLTIPPKKTLVGFAENDLLAAIRKADVDCLIGPHPESELVFVIQEETAI